MKKILNDDIESFVCPVCNKQKISKKYYIFSKISDQLKGIPICEKCFYKIFLKKY